MVMTNGSESPPHFAGRREYIRSMKAFLRKNDISYGELSRALGMDEPSQVSRWFNERSLPREKTIERIDRAVQRILKARKR